MLLHSAMSPAPTRTAALVGITVTLAVPLLPSVVALIVAVPGVHPVTTPLALTWASGDTAVARVNAKRVAPPPTPSPPASLPWTVAPTAAPPPTVPPHSDTLTQSAGPPEPAP